ncbi:hypothetical protein FA15DRAFT_616950 [Coprinopsis marcescibilis]|uniref:Ubiquitin 3 binding protein But2 C-terminal domain-containing protein n=1 Tax=Coprinopsis marcescibilis TaxID=230819 RepID=A0A5C3KZK1_COPMA|nr:hypothetical protein FA15DRAFT_616950 [Coprinopsis marcescibilis]
MLQRGLSWGLYVTVLSSLVLNSLVWSLPWDGLNGRSSMNSMIAGATSIEAVGPLRVNQVPHQRHLGVKENGDIGNATILVHQKRPPLFIINRRQLYLYLNETTVFPVNVHNTTLPDIPPLQLKVEPKKGGITGGGWRWTGSMLHYDFPGEAGYQSLFWVCPGPHDSKSPAWTGIFMFGPKGDGRVTECNSLMLHSFGTE